MIANKSIPRNGVTPNQCFELIPPMPVGNEESDKTSGFSLYGSLPVIRVKRSAKIANKTNSDIIAIPTIAVTLDKSRLLRE